MTDNGEASLEDLVSPKRRITSVDVPGMGRVFIQSMSEFERSLNEFNSYEQMHKGGKSAKRDTFVRVRARAIQTCVVTKEGKRRFSDSEENTEKILNMDARVAELITDVIEKHCGFSTPTEADHADLEKKSVETPVSGSPTS